MREIVHVQLGRSGNRIGNKFWEAIANEHGLDEYGRYRPSTSELQKEYIDAYFSEGADGRRVARALLLDFNCSTKYEILHSHYSSLFKPNNIVFDGAGTNYNWAKGYYSEGADILNRSLEIVRTEVEACDSLQGIQIVHALSGGTGSGFGSLFARHITDEYPDTIKKSYSLLPSSNETYIEPYNAILTIPYLINDIKEVICFSNEAVTNRCYREYGHFIDATFERENYLISQCMSEITACFRFPSELNPSLSKFLINMVPFPQLHFFVPGYVRLIPYTYLYSNIIVRTLIQQMFERTNMFINCNPNEGFLTAAAIFRGRISPRDVDEIRHFIQYMFRLPYYVQLIPDNIKTGICDIPNANIISATSLSNTTAIQHVFMNLLNQFQIMFRNRTHINGYISEGVEISDFWEAQNTLLSLIDGYQNP